MLSPIIPHVCHELWEALGKKSPIHNETWPAFDANQLEGSEMTIAIQINGKLRGKILVDISSSEETIVEENQTVEEPEVSNGLENFEIEEETPELFSSESGDNLPDETSEAKETDNLEEDDLEIPAFLRRQKN